MYKFLCFNYIKVNDHDCNKNDNNYEKYRGIARPSLRK